MTEAIIPLHPRGGRRSAPARIDLVAAELLTEGRSANLQAARIEAVLMDLREQRGQLAALVADLRAQEPAGDARMDEPKTRLIAALGQGIVQLDLFIARARGLQGAPA